MHPRLRAGLVIAAVIVASAIAGAAVDRNLVMRNARRGFGGGDRRGPPPEMEARRRAEMLDRMTKELSLTPVQRAGLDSVFQRTDSSLRAIRREMQPRLKQVFESSRAEMNARLDPAQRQKLASMRFGGPPRGWGEGRGGPPRP